MTFSTQPLDTFAQAVKESYHLTDLILVKEKEGRWKIGRKFYTSIPFLGRFISLVYSRWTDPTSLHQTIEEFTASQSKSYRKFVEKLEKDSITLSEKEFAFHFRFQALFEQAICEATRKCTPSKKDLLRACWTRGHLQSAKEKLLEIFDRTLTSSAGADVSLISNYPSKLFMRQARLNLLKDKVLILGELGNLLSLMEIARSRFENARKVSSRIVKIEGKDVHVEERWAIFGNYTKKINSYINMLSDSLKLNLSVEGPKINPSRHEPIFLGKNVGKNFALFAIGSNNGNFRRWAILVSHQFRVKYLEAKGLSSDQAASLVELKRQKPDFTSKVLKGYIATERLAWKNLYREYKIKQKQEALRAFEKKGSSEELEKPTGMERIKLSPQSADPEVKEGKGALPRPWEEAGALSVAEKLYLKNTASERRQDPDRFFLKNIQAYFEVIMKNSIEPYF
ncbi:hypothetical protein [Parachlamydia sp. AcF125]|uniref:hypothetical protein n=1 Tax=Parachlamydia sp. AcF125 TaxID=2795736 RepID=UPI001BC9974D|nr:hypothetical protein [Parachlamydia sp. AcF125]MBS4168119.1 hypothetical protein [Parachlamydia sp. AcF125]